MTASITTLRIMTASITTLSINDTQQCNTAQTSVVILCNIILNVVMMKVVAPIKMLSIQNLIFLNFKLISNKKDYCFFSEEGVCPFTVFYGA
jgi:hypothetical protein